MYEPEPDGAPMPDELDHAELAEPADADDCQ